MKLLVRLLYLGYEYLFEETVKKKLELVNFITVLCDGSTDNSVTEQEVP